MQMITYKLTKVYVSIFLGLTWVELGIQNAVGVVSFRTCLWLFFHSQLTGKEVFKAQKLFAIHLIRSIIDRIINGGIFFSERPYTV